MFLPTRKTAKSCIASFVLGAACAVLPLAAQAQGKPSAPAADEPGVQNKADKLDVTELEKKYWAAKDTDFSVVQNRTYSKAGRLALSASYGTLLSDPYSDSTGWSGSLTYYFSERYGVELNYTSMNPDDTKSVQYIKSRYGLAADHGKMTQFYGASFNWVPFYAKMSVLNSSIIYFDMQISPGFGITTYEQQQYDNFVAYPSIEKTAPTLTLDVTQHFFLSKHFAFRFDYKNRWFQEEVVSSGGSTTRGTKVKDDTTHNSLLMFGATVFF